MAASKGAVSAESPGYINQFVRWFMDEKTPLYQKVCAAAIPVIAIGATVYRITRVSPLLGALSAVGAVVAFRAFLRSAAREADEIKHRGRMLQLSSTLQANGFEYARLPTVTSDKDNLGLKPWDTRLIEGSLTSPIMRGSNDEGVPFIALKVLDRARSNAPTVLVAYLGQDTWGIRLSSCFDSTSGGGNLGTGPFSKLQPDVQSVVAAILLGNHPRFSLIRRINQLAVQFAEVLLGLGDHGDYPLLGLAHRLRLAAGKRV